MESFYEKTIIRCADWFEIEALLKNVGQITADMLANKTAELEIGGKKVKF